MAKRDEEKFVKVHKACRGTLDRLCKESAQMLNVLALVKLFPLDTDKETALRYQYKRENKAHSDYTRCRSKLFTLLPDSPAIKAIKRNLRAGWPGGGRP